MRLSSILETEIENFNLCKFRLDFRMHQPLQHFDLLHVTKDDDDVLAFLSHLSAPQATKT